ncbi:hypothetical protein FQN50_008935 [Emmonsiellopsis sp. PD_5]|nr:hypothetical protein FQN50_008935 [Emmonsiellopsis sp. PD_5]
MAWQNLPQEIKFLICREIADPDNKPGAVWAEGIKNCLLVSKEWNAFIWDRLRKEDPTVAIFALLGEALMLPILEYSIQNHKNQIEKAEDGHNQNVARDVERPDLLGSWLTRSVACEFKSCVELLLAAGANPNFDDKLGFPSTPMDWAAQTRRTDIAVRLLSHGAHLRKMDSIYEYGPEREFEFPLLCHAARENLIPLVKTLLGEGVPVDQADASEIPLVEALRKDNTEMAVLLLDHGADPGFGYEDNYSDCLPVLPLNVAIMSCSIETVRMLIERGADVNASDEDGLTPLLCAILDKEQVTLLLLEHDAIIEEDHIQKAVRTASLSFLQTLLDYADDSLATVALQESAAANKTEHVQYLLDRDVKPGMLNITAVSCGFTEIVKLLLYAGADPNTTADFAEGSLVDSVEIDALLTDQEAPADSPICRAPTALQIAAAKGHEQVVRILLDAGADVYYPAGIYGTALDAAISSGSEAIQKLLMEHGNSVSGHSMEMSWK